MEKFFGNYRIPSARAKWWHYGWQAPYFVTICTDAHVPFFGQITNRKMDLSPIGQIVHSEWLKTFEIRPDMNLTMGEFVVMPNHFHGIIIIGRNKYNATPTPARFGSQSKNLASVIRGFKTGVTMSARQLCPGFGWQPRYHDHIIRDHEDYQRIAEYIINNPFSWETDKFYIQ